jgi:predicted transcriptional regulator
VQELVWTTTQGTKAIDAAQTLADNPFNCLPVVEEGILMGILTASDFFRSYMKYLDEVSRPPNQEELVVSYVREPTTWISSKRLVKDAIEVMTRQGISALLVGEAPTNDQDGISCAGIVTQTDIVRAYQNSQTSTSKVDVSTLPISALMTRSVVTIAAKHRISDAAHMSKMVGVHHLVVLHQERAIGMLRSSEYFAAIRDLQLETTLAEVMTSSLFTIDGQEPLPSALKYLKQAGLQSLIVTDGGTPIGLFGQHEALLSLTDASGSVESRMSAKLLCLQADTSIFRATQQACALGVEHIVVMSGHEIVGIVSSTDAAGLLVQNSDSMERSGFTESAI